MRTILLALTLSLGSLALHGQVPDCQFTQTFTATGYGVTTAYRAVQNTGHKCTTWRLQYYAVGLSALSIQVEGAPDSNGTAGTFAAVPNLMCSTTQQPPCLLDGSNPLTDASNNTMAFRGYYGWMALHVTTFTGTGKITATMYGYLGSSASAAARGSGSGISICTTDPPTTGAANSFCSTSTGLYQCQNGTSACTTAGQWVLTGPGPWQRSSGGVISPVNSGDSVAVSTTLLGTPIATPTADPIKTQWYVKTGGAWCQQTPGAVETCVTGGTVTGTGTLNVLPRWSNTTGGLQDSAVTDNGTNVLIARPTLVNTTVDLGAMLTVLDTRNASPRGILSWQTSTDTEGARVGFAKARGTAAAPTTVVTGDTLGRLMFRGYDGTNYLEMASIQAVATGTIGTGRVPTYLSFMTGTAAATSVLTEAMRITAAQTVNIGGLTTSLYGLDVSRGVGLTGTARFFDQTATTGSTLVTITPGAAQTSGSTVLALGGSMTTSGLISFLTGSIFSIGGGSNLGIGLWANDSHKIVLNATGIISNATSVSSWTSGDPFSTAIDTGISRVSAGLLAIGTGAQGSIAGALSLATITIGNTSFSFNGKTCTIVATVVTCT